ncbi:DUF3892 domain-containing protein [Polaromonas sp. YR568]|uniref:DUF3892 domain-containing protein n=1 Tax=Polaromonas sp. YR568 TaxID=1855301 RepID=UPI00398BD478
MTIDVEIKYVTKNPRMDPHLAIQRVGGVNLDGRVWSLTLPEAVNGARNGTYHFWAAGAGGSPSAWVEPQISASGNWYLKTVADGIFADNLLSLPDFPGAPANVLAQLAAGLRI